MFQWSIKIIYWIFKNKWNNIWFDIGCYEKNLQLGFWVELIWKIEKSSIKHDRVFVKFIFEINLQKKTRQLAKTQRKVFKDQICTSKYFCLWLINLKRSSFDQFGTLQTFLESVVILSDLDLATSEFKERGHSESSWPYHSLPWFWPC